MLPSAVTSTASRESSEFEFVPSGNGNGHVASASKSSGSDSILGDATGLFGWVKGTGGGLLSKVAERTKSSVESVITTLDPQMKEYIHSGGDFRIVVASDKEVKISPVREAFQSALGKATVFGLASQSTSVATQPLGFAAGRQAANERIQSLQNLVESQDVVIAVESFLFETGENTWAELSCLILSDASRDIHLTSYTQMTPVDAKFIDALREQTGDDYPKRWSGFSVTVGSVLEKGLNVPKEKWHEAICGISRKEILLLAARGLANTYKKCLLAKVETV